MTEREKLMQLIKTGHEKASDYFHKEAIAILKQCEIYSSKDRTKTFEEFVADVLIENEIGDISEYKARLENAVELKAKVGDTIYMPWVYDGNYDIAKLQIIGIDFRKNGFVYITDLESDIAYYLEKYKLGIFRNEDFDNIVFADYDKAEIKLKAEIKEIRGADND